MYTEYIYYIIQCVQCNCTHCIMYVQCTYVCILYSVLIYCIPYAYYRVNIFESHVYSKDYSLFLLFWSH